MTDIKKKGRGRPPWIPYDNEKVESLAARGLTKEQIASCLGISYQTLNEKSKEFADFADAIKRGQDKGISIVANALFEGAKSGNTTAQIFFLKARAKWRDVEAVVEDRNDDEVNKDRELAQKCIKPIP